MKKNIFVKIPLSPGFFPHRPGGHLEVPSQLFKGAQIPSSVRGDDETRRGAAAACLVLSPRNAALPTQIPTTPRPDTIKVPSQPHKPTQIPSSVRAPLGARNAAAPSPDPHNPQTRHYRGAQIPTQLTQIPTQLTQIPSSVRAPAGARNAANPTQIPTTPRPDTVKVPPGLTRISRLV